MLVYQRVNIPAPWFASGLGLTFRFEVTSAARSAMADGCATNIAIAQSVLKAGLHKPYPLVDVYKTME